MADAKYDVTFNLNKYGTPELLDYKTTVANQIVNALFLKPGNLPSLPKAGVDIKQYIYKSTDDLDVYKSKVESDLKYTCGSTISNVLINSVDFSVQKTNKGESVFLLIIRVEFPQESEQLLGISLVEKDEQVRFNFNYTDFL